jgi:hypothetical protein
MKTLLVFLALGSLAFADPLDVITLTDGTVLRGHVTVLKPGDQVEMVLLDQRTQSIAWNDMIDKVGPSFPCDPAAELHTAAPGKLPLVIDSSEPAQINVNDVPVCASTPCTVYVRPGEDVRVAAINGYSDPCAVDVPVAGIPEHVTLHPVSAGNSKRGVGLLIAGIGMAVAGTATAALAASTAGDTHLGGDTSVIEGIGGGIAAGGVGTIIGGIVLMSRKNTAVIDGALHF